MLPTSSNEATGTRRSERSCGTLLARTTGCQREGGEMNTTTTLLQRVKPCKWCGYGPCACSYIRKLRHDGELAHLREIALACFKQPWPHCPACPCPRCYSLRLASWS